jgi:hypothetical protein
MEIKSADLGWSKNGRLIAVSSPWRDQNHANTLGRCVIDSFIFMFVFDKVTGFVLRQSDYSIDASDSF